MNNVNGSDSVSTSQCLAPSAQRPFLYKIIPFDMRHGNCGGSLVQFQQGDVEENALPFKIGKVLVMSDIRTEDVRGNHAHYETEEILVALTGGCTVEMDDGRGSRESVRLSAQGSGGVVECGGKGVDCGKSDVESGLRPIGAYAPASGPWGLQARGEGSNGVKNNPNNQSPITNNPDIKEAVLLYPHVWRTMRDFEPGTTLMVIANIQYDEADYIRDRTEFEQIAEGWSNLGGSAEAEGTA